jgi:hypothetical protein
MNFCFAFNFMGAIPCMIGYINYGLKTGGPVIMVWGFIFASLMTFINGLNLAEIASAFP